MQMDFWKLLGAVPGILVGVGFAMNAIKEFAVSRAIFVIAAAIWSVLVLIFEYTTTDPLLVRVPIGLVTAFTVCVVLPILLAWSRKREAAQVGDIAGGSILEIIPAFKHVGGLVFNGHSGVREGFSFNSIQNPPPGIIMIKLRTASYPGKIAIYYSF